jgi:hypothetical protein
MSTAAITEFNTILAEAHVEAVKALTALLRTATDRTELRRLATTLVRIKRVETGGKASTPRTQPTRKNPVEMPAPYDPGLDEPAPTPRLAPLISKTAARALMAAAASAHSIDAPTEFPLHSPGIINAPIPILTA